MDYLQNILSKLVDTKNAESNENFSRLFNNFPDINKHKISKNSKIDNIMDKTNILTQQHAYLKFSIKSSIDEYKN